MSLGSGPLIVIRVGRKEIDRLHLCQEFGPGWTAWTANGFLRNELVSPDIFYEEFDLFLRHLKPYIAADAKWEDVDGNTLTVLDAVSMLIAGPPNTE